MAKEERNTFLSSFSFSLDLSFLACKRGGMEREGRTKEDGRKRGIVPFLFRYEEYCAPPISCPFLNKSHI